MNNDDEFEEEEDEVEEYEVIAPKLKKTSSPKLEGRFQGRGAYIWWKHWVEKGDEWTEMLDMYLTICDYSSKEKLTFGILKFSKHAFLWWIVWEDKVERSCGRVSKSYKGCNFIK